MPVRQRPSLKVGRRKFNNTFRARSGRSRLPPPSRTLRNEPRKSIHERSSGRRAGVVNPLSGRVLFPAEIQRRDGYTVFVAHTITQYCTSTGIINPTSPPNDRRKFMHDREPDRRICRTVRARKFSVPDASGEYHRKTPFTGALKTPCVEAAVSCRPTAQVPGGGLPSSRPIHLTDDSFLTAEENWSWKLSTRAPLMFAHRVAHPVAFFFRSIDTATRTWI